MTSLLLRGGRVVTDSGIGRADVVVRDGRISEVNAGGASAADEHGGDLTKVVDVDGHVVCPGFVDVHVHAGGGVRPTSADGVAAMAAALAQGGVTTFLLTAIAAPAGVLLDTIGWAAAADTSAGARCAGVHLEGPWVNTSWCGALPAEHFRPPDEDEIERLCARGVDGGVRVVTLAPELPGGIDAVRRLTGHGVVVSLGHSDATYEQARVAAETGARHVTHAFNAMRGLHHREPGLAGAALDLPGLTVEVIADGHHLHPAVVRALWRTRGADGVCLVSDGVDGDIAGLRRDGDVFRTHDGRLAGSALSLASAVRNVVRWGVPLADAVRMAATTPARVLGLTDTGEIRPGARADLVVLDEHLEVARTIVAGNVVHERVPR